MPKRPVPPRLRTRKTDVVADQVASRAVVAKPQTHKPLPGWIAPCVPTLVPRPPRGEQWVHEVKCDGYRISAYVDAGQAVIRTRRGHDWTARFPGIASGLRELTLRSAVLDGEAVILDAMAAQIFPNFRRR